MSDASQGSFIFLPVAGGTRKMPPIGIGKGPGSTYLAPSSVKSAITEAIELGYRHIQITISSMQEHQASGEAIVEALKHRLVNSREDLFITCRIQYHDADSVTISRDLETFLKELNLKYVDLFVIQWLGRDELEPLSVVTPKTDLMTSAWTAMEECQTLGLTKSIGVCNFSSKMLESILSRAKIPPSANQVGMHLLLREKELRDFCLANRISIIASSTIGGKDKHLDLTEFAELEALKKIVEGGQMTTEQVVHRWAFEQGAALLLESLSKEHMQEILNIIQ